MKEQIDLKKLEKRLYLQYSRDGIADLLIGIWLTLAGTLLMIGQPAFIGLSGLPLLLYFPLKKILVVPRIGLVNFSRERKKKLSRLTIIMLFCGVLIFLLVIYGIAGKELVYTSQESILFAFIIAILLIFVAIFTTALRFYLYAAGVFILLAAESIFLDNLPLALVLCGAAIALSGAVMLVSFIWKNSPVADEYTVLNEADND